MGAYEFNKATYKAFTVRLNRMKDQDVIKHLGTIPAVNSSPVTAASPITSWDVSSLCLNMKAW